MQLDSFTRQYLVTALWAGLDDETPLDKNHDLSDIAPETVQKAAEDCARFQEENAADLADDLADIDDEQAGHDFLLTRNHHGAGFWDRGYPEPLATRLTDASHAFGEVWFYVGDDGRIYS